MPARPGREVLRISLPVRLVLAIALASATTVGCGGVVTVEPVGAVPATLIAAEWNGAWCNPTSGLPADVPAPPARPTGDARRADQKPDDKDLECMQFEVSSAPGELTLTDLDDGDRYPAFVKTDASGKVLFITMRDEGKLFWVRAVKEKELLLAWLPDADAFRPLVESGDMPGTAQPGSSGDVTLGALTPSQRGVVEADAGHRLFKWREPLVFVRVRR